MTVRPSEILRRAEDYLARHGVDSPRQNAEALLASVLGTDRAGLYSRTEGLTQVEARTFGRALCRRCTGTPLQHLTKNQPFRTLDLRVRPGVFVPRQETEVVVERALEQIRAVPAPLVADIGTGTGAIALSIAAEHPGARVFAVDSSEDACRLARENAERNDLEVTVLLGDLFRPLPKNLMGWIDLVVSNPPYVDPRDADVLAPEVLADPALALFGGTEVHGRIAAEAPEWLRPSGSLVMEIGADQGEEVAALLRRSFDDVEIHPDMAGRDRAVVARTSRGEPARPAAS